MSGRHEMVRTGNRESGAGEWACTSCSRRLLMRPPPDYARLVLDHGDDAAEHVGGTQVRIVGQVEVDTVTPEEGDRDWLASNGIDWDGI